MTFKGALENKRSRFLLFILLYAVAMLFRFICFSEMQSSPSFNNPIIDSAWRDECARLVLEEGLLTPKIFIRAPLYTYFVALIYGVFGAGNFFWLKLIQHLIGAFSPILVFLIGEKIFSRKTAFFAALVSCIYPLFILFEEEILSPVLVIFLNLLFLTLALRMPEKSPWKKWGLCGLVLGLSAIVRPDVLVFVPFVVLALIFKNWKRGVAHLSKTIGFFLIGFFIVISPVTIRNYIAEKDFALIASYGGINLYAGNNPNATGSGPVFNEVGAGTSQFFERMNFHAEKMIGRKLKPSEVSSYWIDKAVEFIVNDPQKFAALLVKKFYFFWNGFEFSNNQEIYFFRKESKLLSMLIWRYKNFSFPYGVVVPLGLLGFLFALYRRKNILLISFYVLAYMMVSVIFFVTSRYRMPIVPIMLLFAAYGVKESSVLVSRKKALIVPLLIFLGITGIIVNSDLYNDLGRSVVKARAFGNKALTYLSEGKNDMAIEEYKKGLEIFPDDLSLNYSLGTVYLMKGDPENAEKYLKKATDINPDHSKARHNLASIYLQKNNEQQALVQLLAIHEKDPEYFSFNKLEGFTGYLYWRIGDLDKAQEFFIRFYEKNRTDTAVIGDIAVIYYKKGEIDMVFEWLEKASVDIPDPGGPYMRLVDLFLSENRPDLARRCYEELLEIDPNNEKAEKALKRLSLQENGDYE